MGFSVKKRDMHKLALFPFKNAKKIHTKKEGEKPKKSGTAVILTSKIGTVPPK